MVHADVLIIGAGPSGGAAALRLVQAGLSVVCLEQGEWPDRAAFRGGEPDWELTSMKQWSCDPNVRQSPADYAIDESDADVTIANFNGVGGGTVLFNAVWPRMTPNNFRSRSVAGYGDDWPFGYEELLPYYERTDREVGVSGLGGNPIYPPGQEPPLPPLPIFEGGLRMARALAKLDWHWWPETNAILSTSYDGRNQCVARGTCMTGCGEGAKGSADLTYWRHVRSLGGTVITGARVGRIVLDQSGLAIGAEWYDRDGNGFLQTADVVLCAANGIGTPRLLLASAERRYPDGLANGSGLVGKNLMFHHSGFATGVFEESLESWHGHYGSWINSFEFYESSESHGAPGTCKWQLFGGSGQGPLVHTLGLGPNGWGEGHHQAIEQLLGKTLTWYLCVEDVALESNCVELSPTQADSSGVPIPVVHYTIPDQARQLFSWHLERAAESLRAAGADLVVTPEWKPITGHYMGTARMGDDPNRSVVDRFGMSHEIPNLGVLDASVFVTSAGVNPTTTICALASRAADKLLERRAQIPRPEPSHTVWMGPSSVAAAPQPDVPEQVTLTLEEHERLSALAEVLIPPAPNRPTTREAGVGDVLAKSVLAARPDIGPALRRALALPGDPAEALASLTTTDPAARTALELTVAGGYYMSAQVRQAIGYSGQQARPVTPDFYPTYIEEGLLDHMLPS